ncbi:MAG: O-antigen ligase family protein [Acidobacteriota bacterium]|nr:O-antigen ligase family protein [Acidobacteriota bacterium]
MSEPEAAVSKPTRRFLALLWCLVVATVLIPPLTMVPRSFDVFRTPKHVVFLALSLLLIAAAAAGALLSDEIARVLRARSAAVFLALAAAAWTGVTTLTSLRPIASLWKPLTAVCFAAFFTAVVILAARRGLPALVIVFVPATINAIVALLQSTGVWYPWAVDPRVPQRLRTTGLIGNPNDLGTYLVVPAIAAIAAAVVWRQRKWLFAVAALLLIGVASAQSITPVLAGAAGLFAMTITGGTRRLRVAAVVAALALVLAASLHPGSRQRFERLFSVASSGDLPEITSFRVMPAATALLMFRERPLLGAGPGTFSATYMTEKLKADEAHPQWIRPRNPMFGQVHNDHLQVLAETGLPGYLLFIAGLALLASITFRSSASGPQASDPRVRFARLFAFPAALTFAVLALAQFPLQLTSPMVADLYLAALCFTWTESNARA